MTTAPLTADLMFSPLERLIVEAVAAAPRALFAKEVAKRLGEVYGAELKILLKNLVARGVLTHRRGDGYRVSRALLQKGGAV